MSHPIVSVIIPAYNSADTIENCIDSVLRQTVSIFEIIVINDGSTDNTVEVITKFIEKNNQKNLYLISQPNGGPAKARNKGIIAAKGDWIAFLDADDSWLPQKLEKQAQVIAKFPACSIIGTQLFSDNKRITDVCFEYVTFSDMLFQNRFFTSSVIVKKNVLTQFFFDEIKKYSEDYKLWLQIIHRYKGVVLKDGLVIYAENQPRFKRKSLSNNFWKMEINELRNYIFLYQQKYLNVFLLVPVILFSLMKFFKRYFLSIF